MENTILTSLTDNEGGPKLEKAPTGISGPDQITGGGLPQGRVTLVAGSAGAGKTPLGPNFLLAGARPTWWPCRTSRTLSGPRSTGSTCARVTRSPIPGLTGQRWRRGAGPASRPATEKRDERAVPGE
jgi:hypothetical protein